MKTRYHIPTLIIIMTTIVLVAEGMLFFLHYSAELKQEAVRVTELAQSWSHLIESVALHDRQHNHEDVPGGAEAATLSQIGRAHRNFGVFGETGELTLAKHGEDNTMQFIFSHQHGILAKGQSIPFDSKLAEPMRMALTSKTGGTIVGLDYREEMVLAAYEPIAVLNYGVVAKIDLNEIRQPFIHTSLFAGGITVVLIGIGVILFFKVTLPLIRRITESEEKYRTLFDNSADGILLTTDRLVDCNKEACHLFGCDRGDIIGKMLGELSPATQPDGRNSTEAARAHITAALTLKGRQQQWFFWCFKRKDGTFFDAQISLKAIEMEGVKLVMALIWDLTEKKLAEQALQRSQQFLISTGRMAKVGGWEFDTETLEVRWTEETHRIYELPLDHTPPLDESIIFFHPEDRSIMEKATHRAIEHGDPYNLELRFTTSKGRSLWVHTICNPVVVEGKTVKLSGTIQDITKNKRIQEALNTLSKGVSQKTGDSFFQSLALNIADAMGADYSFIGVFKDEGREKVKTLAVCADGKIIENIEYDLKGTPCSCLLQNDEEDPCFHRSGIQELFPEDELLQKMGIEAYFGKRLYYLSGEMFGIMVLLFRKPVSEHLLPLSVINIFAARVSMELERMQAEEKKEKFEAISRHQQKLESIGTLAGGVAHEINNPINGIINYAQLISDKLDKDNSLRKYAESIIRESDRISTIVRNLLAFSRDEKETHSPARMADIVKNTISLIQTIIQRDQIAMDVQVVDNLPKINCRSQQIQQVLMNLLTNGRDALNERYPGFDENKILRVKVAPFEKEGRQWIRTTVEDHGPGITEEIGDRIFDPFFTTKDKTKGTGLGLSISYGIVQEHHGLLYFGCVPGQFTRFYLELPVNNRWVLGGRGMTT